MHRLFALLVLLLALSPLRAQGITVYRCVGKDGAVALRDSPCLPGETQQVRNMLKPKDAPMPTAAATPAAAPEKAREKIVVRTPVQPMYECTNVETGANYVSDDNSGNPRWATDFALAPAVGWQHAGPLPGPRPLDPMPAPGLSVWHATPHSGVVVHVPLGPPLPPPPTPGVLVPAGGHVVRDACRMLPQADTCARLNDRRYEILKSYGVVSQDKERELANEQRGIDARLANDCEGD